MSVLAAGVFLPPSCFDVYLMVLQDSSALRDEEFVTNLNRTLADPNIIAIWDARNIYPTSEASTSAAGPSTSQPSTM
jgi:hypothetical protein